MLVELELARLDLREVQDVVDDAEQRVAGATAVWTYSRWTALSAVPASSSSMPITPFSGVRISWLMLARNSDLIREASTAAANARRLSETSVATEPMA